MADMRPAVFPDDRREHAHDREHEVFDLLKAAFPDETTVLYEPAVFNHRRVMVKPDFVLLDSHVDIVALEVKNWNKTRIMSGNTHDVIIEDDKMPEGQRTVKNPIKQAQDYSYAIMSHVEREFAAEPLVVNQEGRNQGKVKPVVLHAVVFMGVSESDLPEMAQRLGNQCYSDLLISEEALRDPDLLKQRLESLPRPRGLLRNANCLKLIANQLCPPEVTPEALKERVEEHAIAILPAWKQAIPEAVADETAIEKYQRLRNTLKVVATETRNLISKDDEEPDDRVADLDNTLERLNNDVFRIGLFGVTAAGKSTFLNALLGEELLRPGLGETSKVITRIMAPTKDHPHGTEVIVYKTYEDLVSQSERFLTVVYTDEFQNEKGTLDLKSATVRTKVLALKDKPDGADKFFKALVAGWQKSFKLLGTEVVAEKNEDSEDAIHDEKVALFIAERRIHWDNKLTVGKGFEFVDTPGVASTLARHTETAVQAAAAVDAALMLTKVDYKFMPPDRQFIEDVGGVQRHRERKNLCFILNQIDRIDPRQFRSGFDECVNSQCDELKARLQDMGMGLEELPIWPISASTALWSQRMISGGDGIGTDEVTSYKRSRMYNQDGDPLPSPEENLEASRFPELRKSLLDHLTSIKYHSFLGSRLDEVERVADGFRKDIEEELTGLGAEIGTIKKSIKEHHESTSLAEAEIGRVQDRFLGAKIRILAPFNTSDKDNEKGRVDKMLDSLEMELSGDGPSSLFPMIRDFIKEMNAHRSFKIAVREFFSGKRREQYNAFRQKLASSVQGMIEEYVIRVRKECEREYSDYRDNSIGDSLKELVSRFVPEDGVSSIELLPVRVKDSFPASNLRKLFPSRFIALFEYLFKEIWDFRSTREEMTRKRSKALVERAVKVFGRDIRPDLNEAITSWIEADFQNCHEKIPENFEKLTKAIENRLQMKLESRRAKEGERKVREKQLKHFQEQTKQLFACLAELREQIEKSRPTQPLS